MGSHFWRYAGHRRSPAVTLKDQAELFSDPAFCLLQEICECSSTVILCISLFDFSHTVHRYVNFSPRSSNRNRKMKKIEKKQTPLFSHRSHFSSLFVEKAVRTRYAWISFFHVCRFSLPLPEARLRAHVSGACFSVKHYRPFRRGPLKRMHWFSDRLGLIRSRYRRRI